MNHGCHKYIYKGPVMSFGRCVSNCWEGATIAESESRARTNLAYQYKKQHGLSAGTKISVTGPLTVVHLEGVYR